MPFNPRTGYGARAGDPETWATFDEACKAVESGQYAGIGFEFAENGGYVGVDFDHCIDQNGALSAWAIDVNAHYVFKLSDMFGFYPLAGLDLSFWKVSLGNSASLNKTRLGANIGLGGEVYATDQLSVGLEFKYNILKSWGDLRLSQPLLALRIGYNF